MPDFVDTHTIGEGIDGVLVGQSWRRNPPGREVCRVERVWHWGGDLNDPVARLRPLKGGKPLVISPHHLKEDYALEVPDA